MENRKNYSLYEISGGFIVVWALFMLCSNYSSELGWFGLAKQGIIATIELGLIGLGVWERTRKT
jgi:hypothetical protein